MLGGLLGGKGGGSGARSTGAGDLLGSLLNGGSSGQNPLSEMLGATSGGGAGSGSEMLGLLMGGGEPQEPPREAQAEAELLVEAMCNAAKADGTIDEGEQEKILGNLGELDEDETAWLREHLAGPADVDAFAAKIPDDMDEQVYAFSLMAIKLDTRSEAEYFGRLASGLGLDADSCNRIHARLGQPEIFA